MKVSVDMEENLASSNWGEKDSNDDEQITTGVPGLRLHVAVPFGDTKHPQNY